MYMCIYIYICICIFICCTGFTSRSSSRFRRWVRSEGPARRLDPALKVRACLRPVHKLRIWNFRALTQQILNSKGPTSWVHGENPQTFRVRDSQSVDS